MPSIEHIIAKILSARPELTREDVLRAIEERERRAKGFLTRESAALSLAADLGIIIESNFKREMRIKDLVSGLHNVTIAGRVIYVSQLRKFRRASEKDIVARNVYVSDGTGTAKVTLWGDAATSFNPEDLINKVVRFSHLSVRRKYESITELSASSKSKVEINPVNIKDGDYPPLTLFTKKICELAINKNKMVNVLGIIRQVYPATTFKRQDGGEGKVRRVEIADRTGKAILVLWDERADIVSDAHIGRQVVLFGVKVKERFDGSIELHTGDRTEIIMLKEKVSDFE